MESYRSYKVCMGGCIDLISSTVWLVSFIYFRSVNYSLIYLCMKIAIYERTYVCMYVCMYADVNYFVVVCMYVYILYKNYFLVESDRYALSSVSLRTVTSIGQYAFQCKYPDLLLVW